jgi:hypothetical protein
MICTDFSAGGATVHEPDAETPLSVAVTVTTCGELTFPAWTWNCIQAMFACMVMVAGTGSAFGSELLIWMTAALGGAVAS